MGSADFEMRHRIVVRPRKRKSGEVAFALPWPYVRRRHELALTVTFITNRLLFGLAYRGLQPDYFDNMPRDSGVYLCPIVPTSELVPGAVYPGDIDLLVIPYESDELVLHRTMAVEIKAVRALFTKQGKSPNEFGFSQAQGLLDFGFPFVGVAHLIVSDESPSQAWRDATFAQVVGQNGRIEFLPEEKVDLMPIDLIKRTFGRLQAASRSPEVGLIAAYLGSSEAELSGTQVEYSVWVPLCHKASANTACRRELLEKVVNLFEQRPACFFDNPRFDSTDVGDAPIR
jgi:hypothetical protein